MHKIEVRRCGVDIRNDRQRHVIEPDIFAHGTSGAGGPRF